MVGGPPTAVPAKLRKFPCDRCRNLSVRTAWSAVTYKNALLPVWIAALLLLLLLAALRGH